MRSSMMAAATLALVACSDSSGSMDGGARDLSATRDFSGSDDFGVGDLSGSRDLRQSLMCDLKPAAQSDGGASAALWLAAAGTTGDLLTARYTEGGGWVALATISGADTGETAIAVVAGQPLVALRQQANHALKISAYDPCGNAFGALQDPFANAFAAHRPALAGDALVFQGGLSADQRLYFAPYAGGAFAAPTTQASLLTNTTMTALAVAADTHAVFAGTDKVVYDATVTTSPGGGSAVAAGGGTTLLAPSAAALADGTFLVVFTGEDTNLYWSGRGPGGFLAPQQLCTGLGGCLDDSNGPPALTATADGGALAAWVGKNGQIYSATFTPSATLGLSRWTAATPASGGETTALAVTLAPGVGSALAELAYVRASDGALRHQRWQPSSWTPTTTFAGALGATPSLTLGP